jgi:hypothetical protein
MRGSFPFGKLRMTVVEVVVKAGVAGVSGAALVLAAITMAAKHRAAAVRACAVGVAVKRGGKLQRR